MMLRLSRNQRALLAGKACDAGNLAAGALVFGQFLPDRSSVLLAATGLVIWVGFGIGALKLLYEEQP